MSNISIDETKKIPMMGLFLLCIVALLSGCSSLSTTTSAKNMTQPVMLGPVHYVKSNKKIPRHYYETQRFFAPIYDSGSCLGRELLDEKIESLLKNDNELNSYVDRGTSEIHWSNSKIKHYKLIDNLLRSGYGKQVSSIIENALAAFDLSRFTAIIESIDDKVPSGFEKYKIPYPRKQLIIKMVALRIQKLREIRHEGI